MSRRGRVFAVETLSRDLLVQWSFLLLFFRFYNSIIITLRRINRVQSTRRLYIILSDPTATSTCTYTISIYTFRRAFKTREVGFVRERKIINGYIISSNFFTAFWKNVNCTFRTVRQNYYLGTYKCTFMIRLLIGETAANVPILCN